MISHSFKHALSVIILFSTFLWAVPRYALESGSSCILCHVNPAGGGLRNDYGIAYGIDDLAVRSPEKFSSYSGIIINYIQIGGDVRIQSVSKNKGDVPSGLAVFPMQAKLQVKAEVKKLTVLAELAALQSYLGLQLRYNQKNVYVKAGLAKPSFGLNSDDHTVFTRGGNIRLVHGDHREGMPFLPTLTNVGLIELGIIFGDTYVSFSRSNGYISGEGNTIVGRLEHYRSIQATQSMIGGSILFEGDLQMFSLFGGLNRGRLSWMGEVTLAENLVESRSIASYSELTWKVKRGWNLSGRIDFFDESMKYTEDAIRRTTFGLNYVPLPFVDIKFQIRSSQLSGSKPSKGMEFLSQLHLWF